jgi:hypothetical protein
MAVVSYDLKITLTEGVRAGRPITSDERSRLFDRPDVVAGRRSTPRLTLPATGLIEEEIPAPTGRERLISLVKKSKNLSTRIEARIDTITEECRGLDYYFDPSKHPELAAAVNAVFSGVNNRITFRMYKRAMRLDSEIMIAITEEQIDGII